VKSGSVPGAGSTADGHDAPGSWKRLRPDRRRHEGHRHRPSDLVPDKENLIIGGGTMVLDGIIYLPKQPLKVTGNGDIGLDAKQFAIIADTIDIEGNGQLNIRISNDYKDAGLPPLPEAHEGIRLVN
jgi:hypothetical protein